MLPLAPPIEIRLFEVVRRYGSETHAHCFDEAQRTYGRINSPARSEATCLQMARVECRGPEKGATAQRTPPEDLSNESKSPQHQA